MDSGQRVTMGLATGPGAARRTASPVSSRAGDPVRRVAGKPGRRRIRPAVGERGAVTGEFAAALPAAVLVLMLLISLAMHGAAQVSLEAGVRAAARETARGADEATAIEAARRVADEELEVSISRDGDYARVRAVRPVRILGLVEIAREQTAEAEVPVEHLPAAVEPGDSDPTTSGGGS
ncbi:TadE family type IV pilus minor pilin [Nesterenkonia sp. F]|uniref:TadE family type IV pilus minor pilin n=1 Tax=Nesterenkonia sp. F TaxID=795955 RepID=UPI000255CF79|nr:TadE family type IV pilus minor pilin [Nesterenkonia sp. F]